MNEITKSKIDEITYEIVGAAIEVHRQLGPGLLESVYHECMKIELKIRGLKFETEMKVPIIYEDYKLESILRCDLFVENLIPVELKSVLNFSPVFEAQILTYMRLLNAPKGVLINFNCKSIFHSGQKTFVNNIYRKLPD